MRLRLILLACVVSGGVPENGAVQGTVYSVAELERAGGVTA